MHNKFYKGYGELIDKVPKIKRKSRCIKPEWNEVGGYLTEDYILFDIDDKDVNANLFFEVINHFNIKCHITESVNGIHAIFRKPNINELPYGNEKESLIGIKCDYKCGFKGQYERIIVDGEPLQVINECDEPDALPWLLFPFARPRDLQQVKHGDGRHNILLGLSNVYALYENNTNKILNVLNWVNENVFAEARKSVNISIADIQDSIVYMNKNYTDAEFYDMIKDADKNKVIKLLVQYGIVEVKHG